jgi:hypothetical protein
MRQHLPKLLAAVILAALVITCQRFATPTTYATPDTRARICRTLPDGQPTFSDC